LLMKTKFFLRLSILFTMFFLPFAIYAQIGATQNPIWVLPPYYSFGAAPTNQLDLLPVPNISSDPAVCYQGQKAEHASNGIAKNDGSIYFFIVDQYIYDGGGMCIGILKDESFQNGEPFASGHSEIIILKKPALTNCGEYYIFTSKLNTDLSAPPNNITNWPDFIPVYAILNMTAPSDLNPNLLGNLFNFGNSGIVKTITNLPSVPPVVGPSPAVVHYASSKDLNGKYFLFCITDNILLRYVVDNIGVVLDNAQPDFGVLNINSTGGDGYLRAEMELLTIETPAPADNAVQGSSSQPPPANGIYFKLAVPTEVGSNNSRIICFSLDANGMEIPAFTKVINLPVSTDPLVGHSLKGLEFSGNGDWLYTSNMLTPTEVAGNLSPIAVYNVSQPNNISPAINVMNCNGCGNISSYRFSQIERSKNWDLYMTNGTNWLTLSQAIVDNPTTGMNSWTASSNLNYTYDFNFGDITPDMTANNFPNYGSKLYTLPDQNDNQNYATYFMLSNPTCCETYQGYYTNPLDGSNDVTINSSNLAYFTSQPFLRFNGTVTISAGTVLSLNNKTWEFGPNGLILVKPNAKFYASYSTLKATTLCANPQMWKGIWVSGNCNSSALSAQGFVQFLSSTLSDAIQGIAVYNIPGALSSGGIARCLKTTFINNQTSIYFNGNCTATFPNSNSWLRNCTFDWNNSYLGNSVLNNFISKSRILISLMFLGSICVF
jgi:hypothetical protein